MNWKEYTTQQTLMVMVQYQKMSTHCTWSSNVKNLKIKMFDESDFQEVSEEQEDDEADNISFQELA